MKDESMREKENVIKGEVIRMMEDVGSIEERVRKLKKNLIKEKKDIEDIIVY